MRKTDKFLKTIITDVPMTKKWKDKLTVDLSISDLEEILILYESFLYGEK
jgi:hypothetical protein